MKSKRSKIIFVAAIILALAIVAFIYKQPVEIGDMYDWDFDRCTQISVHARYDEGEFQKYGRMKEYLFSLEKGEEGFEELLHLLRNKVVKKSFWSLIPREIGMHPAEQGDFVWYIDLNGQISINNFFGKEVSVSRYGGEKYKLSIDKNDPWLKEVFDTAVKYAE